MKDLGNSSRRYNSGEEDYSGGRLGTRVVSGSEYTREDFGSGAGYINGTVPGDRYAPKIRMTTEQIPKTDPITAPAVRTVIWIIISMMTRMMIIRMKAGISILTAIPVRIRIMIPGRI